MRGVVRAAALAILLCAGVAVADPVRVFILGGQSNAVGYGSDASLLPPALSAPQTDVRFWFDEGSFFALSNPALRIDSGDALVSLQFQSDPSTLTFAGPVNGFGPELTLGRTLADALPLEIAIVKFAVSGSSLAVDWNPATAGSLYHQMRDDVDGALAALAAMGDSGQIAGVVWMQGEADAITSVAAAAYEANLTSLIAQLRSDFGNAGLPFAFGRINDNIDTSCCFSFPFKDTVRTAQANVAAAVSRVSMVDTDDLPLIGDNLHFTAAGQQALGQRLAAEHLGFPAACGDGNVDAGEECDDGNTLDGDCCSASCSQDPPSSPCGDEGNACTADECSAVGVCVHVPIADCVADELVPGKSAVVKAGQLTRFVAKPPAGGAFFLPGSVSEPIAGGGTVQFFDLQSGAGQVTYALDAQAAPFGWKGLGTPPGAKGYKYKGAGSSGDPCTSVVIKATVVKAVCKGTAVTLSPPFAGDLGVVLAVGSVPKRYCARFGGTTTKNDPGGLVRRVASAPAVCPMAP